VSQATDTDHHALRTRPEGISAQRDGVIGRQSGIREGGGLREVEVARTNQMCLRDDHVVRHAAVAREPQAAELHNPALVLQAEDACPAATAAEERVDDDRLADLPSAHARSEAVDVARDLVAEREGRGERAGWRGKNPQVGVARSAGANPDEHLAEAGLGGGDLDELGLVLTGVAIRAHGSRSCRVMSPV
jgi:hypothetical protein